MINKIKTLLIACLLLQVMSVELIYSDTEDCRYVEDGCPVWDDAYPKCHIGPIECNGR